MIVNGNKLHDSEVFALAQYAAATGLDPFAGECWIIPGKGVCPGIAGWRKKAQDQLDYEAREAHQLGSHFWVTYEDAENGSCIFDAAKGDIAYVAVLRDSVSQTRWRQSIIAASSDFVKMGAKFTESIELAKSLVGAEPVWIGYGVVFGSETFGGTEKFDRKERAKKRAEKVALRKRFPRIHLPEPDGIDDVVDPSDYAVVMDSDQMDEHRAMVDLGFEQATEAVFDNEFEQAKPEPAPQQKVAYQAKPEGKMTLEFANGETNRYGVKYGDIDTETLSNMANALTKMVKRTDEQERKLTAAQTILSARNGG
jgi:hypothetical protein